MFLQTLRHIQFYSTEVVQMSSLKSHKCKNRTEKKKKIITWPIQYLQKIYYTIRKALNVKLSNFIITRTTE